MRFLNLRYPASTPRRFGLLLVLAAFPLLSSASGLRSAWLLEQGAPPATQQPPAERRTLKVEDYAQWESLGPAAISNDGKWFASTVNKVDMDGFLAIRSCDGPERAVVPFGTAPRFSDDSKWAGYTIQVAKKEAEKLREQKKPVENKLGLRDLGSGREMVYDNVQSWSFTKGGKYLVAQRYRAASRQSGGGDLLILNLASGGTVTVGNVAGFSLQKDGRFMALRIDSGGAEKGIQVYDFQTGNLRDVSFKDAAYSAVSWAEDRPVLGFLMGIDDPKKEGPANTIYLVSGFNADKLDAKVYDPAKDDGFPDGFRIAESGGLQLTEAGDVAAFGIRPWDDKKKPDGKPEDKSNVDVWHYKDYDLQPYQQRRVDIERNRTQLCLWRPALSKGFSRIGSDEIDTVRLLKGFGKALWQNTAPYEDPMRPGGVEYADWYVIDTLTGHKTRVLEKRQFAPVPSRDGGYLAYFAQKAWWVYDIAADKATNVTSSIKRDFWDVDDDHTLKEKPAQGFPVWLAEDKGLIVSDKYDCFLIDPATGKNTQLTNGKGDGIEYQIVDAGFGEEGIDLKDPLYFRAFGETTKKSGYYRCEPGGAGGATLVYEDANLSAIRRAKDVDRMVFMMQSFVQSPDWYLTNEKFVQAKPLTRTNPQQKDFFWGKTELIDYKSKWGKELQATLIYPADYKPGLVYPMVTYIYERLTDGFHNYQMPSPWNAYNVQHWSQQGYFVLMPDIAYRDRQPGKSAVECLEPAVLAAVLKRVGVDPAKVGLVGHSWGGYQTAYVPTQSKVFAAAVAGAPLTELISMYNSFYWNAGITDQVIFESSQGRMEVPWYEDVKAYTDNSPVWQAKNLTTPMMIAFGDQDGAVDWHQGQQYYNTLRRMGKQIIMLVYPGENHGLAKRPNQLDYAHRVRHFFDVYLKNVPPEKWVTEGVPAIKKGEGG